MGFRDLLEAYVHVSKFSMQFVKVGEGNILHLFQIVGDCKVGEGKREGRTREELVSERSTATEIHIG